mgnify:CR=1 FL=1
MYFINGIPFTFDDIPLIMQEDPYIQVEAQNNYEYTSEDMYRWSNYLIDEMFLKQTREVTCLPCSFRTDVIFIYSVYIPFFGNSDCSKIRFREPLYILWQ